MSASFVYLFMLYFFFKCLQSLKPFAHKSPVCDEQQINSVQGALAGCSHLFSPLWFCLGVSPPLLLSLNVPGHLKFTCDRLPAEESSLPWPHPALSEAAGLGAGACSLHLLTRPLTSAGDTCSLFLQLHGQHLVQDTLEPNIPRHPFVVATSQFSVPSGLGKDSLPFNF